MADKKKKRVKQFMQSIRSLSNSQLYWLEKVLQILDSPHRFEISHSDLFNEQALQNFGDAIRIHHSFSAEPLSKDRFEYVLANVLCRSGHKAKLAAKGNRGYDISIDGKRVSLKTQADRNIRKDRLWISKFMELGKGQWGDDPKDLVALRDLFLEHMKDYERILTLRALERGPHWYYELVEIPKSILRIAANGRLEMKSDSKQYPKPGYCHVLSPKGEAIFQLYFDGGSERKLQIKHLLKSCCTVHATWQFVTPQEEEPSG